MERAACRGKDTKLFFPERGESQRPGKDICAPCEVKFQCGEYQKRTHTEHGMWGGRMVQRRRSSR